MAQTDMVSGRGDYLETEVEAGLLLLAHTGSPTKAAEALSQDIGRKVHESIVRYWRDHSHAERYAEIRREQVPAFQAHLAAKYEDAAAQAVDKATEMIALLNPSALTPAELAKSIQPVSVSSGVFTDKAQTLRGLPNIIIQKQDANELLDQMARLIPGSIVNSTAEEIEDAEVEDDKASTPPVATAT